MHLWSSHGALVLKKIMLHLADLLPISKLCTHVKSHGGLKAVANQFNQQRNNYKHVIRSGVKHYYGLFSTLISNERYPVLTVYLIKESLYLLLGNVNRLSDKQCDKLKQLQSLWWAESYEEMASQLESWCRIADVSNMTYLKNLTKSLRRHCIGVCNYAKHQLASARTNPITLRLE